MEDFRADPNLTEEEKLEKVRYLTFRLYRFFE